MKTTVEWFLIRAAGHLTPQPCVGHVYNGTCPNCRAQELLMNLAVRGRGITLEQAA
jgi:hypothetical protein